MRVLVVYESMFGDARAIAEAIAAGATAAGARTQCLEVAHAPDEVPAEISLLVAGSPTHGFGMPRPATRDDAANRTDQPLVSQGRGLREWLAQVRPLGTTRFTTFDTRMDHPRMVTALDHASRSAAKALKRAGFEPAADPAHFFVEDVQGPLRAGEADRAQQWGRELASAPPAVN